MSIKKRELPRETSKPMATQPIKLDASDTVLGICLPWLGSKVA